MKHSQERIAHELRTRLGLILSQRVSDPRLAQVTVSEVKPSKDLSVARVYYSMLDPDADSAPVQQGLEKAAGFLRAKLGQAIKVRHVPELRFEHDDSAAEGQRISDLIDRAIGSDRAR